MKLSLIAAGVLSGALVAAPAAVLHAQPLSPLSPPQISVQLGWDHPPAGYHEAGRQGFHDGLEAAHFDWMNHRPMDPHHHARFNHPPVPPPAWPEYRRGFVRGYYAAMHHRGDWGHHQWDPNWH